MKKFKNIADIIAKHRKKAEKKQLKKYFLQYRYKPLVFEELMFADPYYTDKLPEVNNWRRHKGYAHLHSLNQALDTIVRDKDNYKARYYEFKIEAPWGVVRLH